MKLIRLVDNSKDGILENNFNDGFEIKPNSKVALQDVSIQLDAQEFLVDHSNDNVVFQYNANDPATAQNFDIPAQTYNKDSADTLRAAIQNGLNRTQGYNVKQIGFQFDVDDKDNKTRIESRFCPNDFNIFRTNVAAPYGDAMNDATITAGIISQTGAGGVADDRNTLYSNQTFGKGSAVFRTRISRLVDIGGAASDVHGFDIGLSDINPQSWDKTGNFTLPDATKTFNIRVRKTTDEILYNTKGNVNQASGFSPKVFDGTRNSDIIEIAIFENKIRGKVYTSDGNVANQQKVLFEVDLNVAYPNAGQNTFLYPYIIFHAADANCRLDSYTRCFFDPFKSNIKPSTFDDAEDELGALPQPPSPARPATAVASQLFFESFELAQYLGFEENLLLTQDPTRISFITHSENIFKAGLKYDNIIVETMNLQLESYDGLEKGRRNILASVPTIENSNGVIVYEPNNQNFLDIRNQEAIILRNFRVRVLFSDLTDCPTVGLNAITILIKSPDE